MVKPIFALLFLTSVVQLTLATRPMVSSNALEKAPEDKRRWYEIYHEDTSLWRNSIGQILVNWFEKEVNWFVHLLEQREHCQGSTSCMSCSFLPDKKEVCVKFEIIRDLYRRILIVTSTIRDGNKIEAMHEPFYKKVPEKYQCIKARTFINDACKRQTMFGGAAATSTIPRSNGEPKFCKMEEMNLFAEGDLLCN